MKNFIQLTEKSDFSGGKSQSLLLNIANILSVKECPGYTHIVMGTGIFYKVEEAYGQVLSLIENAQSN